jgi:hypothetical protein
MAPPTPFVMTLRGFCFPSFGFNGSNEDEEVVFIFHFCLLVWLALCIYHGWEIPSPHLLVLATSERSTSTVCNHWLSLAKIALKVPLAGRNRSLVADTIRFGKGKSRARVGMAHSIQKLSLVCKLCLVSI